MAMNPMGMIMQMMKGGTNPQQMLQGLMGNNQIMQNPMAANAINMAKSGNMKGVEDLARNLCKQKGVNVDDALGQIRQQLGV